jgi:hypothetical protein
MRYAVASEQLNSCQTRSMKSINLNRFRSGSVIYCFIVLTLSKTWGVEYECSGHKIN